MSKNPLYANEIATANLFIVEHSWDTNFMNLLSQLKDKSYTHSDRWSIIYDYMKDNYSIDDGRLITGLSYWIEE